MRYSAKDRNYTLFKKDNLDKHFIPATHKAVCPNMKLITLDKLLCSLEEMTSKIIVPKNTRIKAKTVVDKMFKISGDQTSSPQQSIA